MAKTAKQKLGDYLKQMIGKPAPVDMLDGWQDIINEMAEGKQAPAIAELIAMKVLKAAVDPNRPNQWAVELVFDRVDGKAIQQASGESRDVIEERLDDISRQHLNDLAALSTATSGSAEAEAEADRPVANPLGALSSYRPPDSEGAGGEPEVEDGPPEAG
jgi:hypothetical protein